MLSTRKSRILFIGLLFSLAIIASLCVGLWVFAHRPLTTPLANLPAVLGGQSTVGDAPLADSSIPAENLTPLPSPEGFVIAASEAVIPTPTPQPGQTTLCDGPHLMFIQIAGIDRYNLADAIRILRADFGKAQISVLAIQRATWVSIPHLEEYGITAGLVNSAHSYGTYFYGEDAGIYLLSETIALNFGIRSDRYIDVNFASFVKAVDTVGGVDVTLQDGYYDAGSQKYYEPGTHHLDGTTALEFVRMRYSDTDWKRIDRQTDMLMSLFTQLTELSMLPELPGLAYRLKDDFATDLSPIEINQLACLASNISTESIKFYEIGLDMVTPTILDDKNHSQVMIPNFDLIRPFVEAFINGSLP